MATLSERRILLGVTGGIAAYKSVDLVRRLREQGAVVQVVMTRAATGFVGPLSFQAVSGRAVRLDLLDPEAEAGMGHIELARWPELILIAPASADCLARLAHGLADDLLSTLCLASDRPLAVAPAMNRLMWAHPATRASCDLLAKRGVRFWGPGEGDQACGEIGAGRMLEPDELRQCVVEHFRASRELDGLEVLVTAGPTRENIDPVRFISNHSSGRMGFAVAAAAARAGARVTLVSGPSALPTPAGVERIDVQSAREMLDAVQQRAARSAIFIAVAAVSDYRVAEIAGQKIKKHQERLSLQLERNPDILGTVAAMTENRPFCVGFAAETDAVLDYARHKLEAKRLDMIAANRVGVAGGGFDSATNALHVLWPGGGRDLAMTDKTELARQLVGLIAERYHARDSAETA
ncbi:MAG: bifunctional phosphopantothenoylcysteine decarboxylase/phosphopantothenate--cysteine ligase CoaBC [Candidatus Competibacterales bacterium]|nr:bifunctional phosphopantothenoylcysteine decarboxylase/phosphopantothenate--cysteine ligase CoaBC [Candidatus Competibacterales bacterium]